MEVMQELESISENEAVSATVRKCQRDIRVDNRDVGDVVTSCITTEAANGEVLEDTENRKGRQSVTEVLKFSVTKRKRQSLTSTEDEYIKVRGSAVRQPLAKERKDAENGKSTGWTL